MREEAGISSVKTDRGVLFRGTDVGGVSVTHVRSLFAVAPSES